MDVDCYLAVMISILIKSEGVVKYRRRGSSSDSKVMTLHHVLRVTYLKLEI